MSERISNDKQKIGILGGTFNPIHIGHLILAEQARSEFSLDKVILMPSGVSYFKKDLKVLPADIRYEMTAIACKDNPHFCVSDMEIRRKGNTYTADTIQELKKQSPDTHYYFIIGADTLLQMETWYHPELIFDSCTVLCAVRDKLTPEELQAKKRELVTKYAADIEFLHTTNLEISSKMLRNMVLSGRSIRYYVTDEVLHYIEEHDLYHQSDKDGL